MALTLSSDAIVEKNKISNTGAWIVLLEITLSDSTVIRICTNEDTDWPSGAPDTYTGFPFEIEEIIDNSAGEVSQVMLRVSNASKALVPYLDDADGGRGASVRIMLVHSAHLDNTTPEIDMTFECTRSSFNNQWVSFSLTTLNRYNRTFPKGRIMASFCRYPEFGGDRCGFDTGHGSYDGNGCDRSWTRCQALWTQVGSPANKSRFGGAPGVGRSSFYD